MKVEFTIIATKDGTFDQQLPLLPPGIVTIMNEAGWTIVGMRSWDADLLERLGEHDS